MRVSGAWQQVSEPEGARKAQAQQNGCSRGCGGPVWSVRARVEWGWCIRDEEMLAMLVAEGSTHVGYWSIVE